MATTEIIRLEQMPVINHDLLRIGKMVEDRISVLNLDNLVATEDTIKSMKSLRTELNAEFKDFEEQRKAVKAHVTKPYDEMESIYKEQITEKYTSAVNTLKTKITEFEDVVKKEKELEVEVYFDELCEAENIDFLSFDKAGIKVGLSNSMKSLKEQAAEFVNRVKSDIELIETQEHKTAIYVEYHKDLNASRAIKEVSDRIQAEKAEKERQHRQMLENRHAELVHTCNVIFDKFTDSYVEVSAKLYDIPKDFVINASDAEFSAKVEEVKKIKEQRSAINRAEQLAKEKLEAPVVVQQAPPVYHDAPTPPQVLTAKFAVQGTREQLEALRDYLINNNLTYENI